VLGCEAFLEPDSGLEAEVGSRETRIGKGVPHIRLFAREQL